MKHKDIVRGKTTSESAADDSFTVVSTHTLKRWLRKAKPLAFNVRRYPHRAMADAQRLADDIIRVLEAKK